MAHTPGKRLDLDRATLMGQLMHTAVTIGIADAVAGKKVMTLKEAFRTVANVEGFRGTYRRLHLEQIGRVYRAAYKAQSKSRLWTGREPSTIKTYPHKRRDGRVVMVTVPEGD